MRQKRDKLRRCRRSRCPHSEQSSPSPCPASSPLAHQLMHNVLFTLKSSNIVIALSIPNPTLSINWCVNWGDAEQGSVKLWFRWSHICACDAAFLPAHISLTLTCIRTGWARVEVVVCRSRSSLSDGKQCSQLLQYNCCHWWSIHLIYFLGDCQSESPLVYLYRISNYSAVTSSSVSSLHSMCAIESHNLSAYCLNT